MAGAPGLSIARSLTSLTAFLSGASIGGRLGLVMATAQKRWLLAAGISEAGLLLVVAFVAIGFDAAAGAPATRLYIIIVLTAVAMGLRNATVRKLALPDLRTTVLTLTLTGRIVFGWRQ